MVEINSLNATDFDNIVIDEKWNFGDSKELKMHSIHAYPAKFPSFIASKAFEYAEDEGVNIKSVADIFCGCGTVALEAKLHGKEFWGCDINPVATLIAKTKSSNFKIDTLNKVNKKILETFEEADCPSDVYAESNERLRYWFSENNYVDLYKLKQAIEKETRNGKYREAFFCIFSSILKPCSRWLTKSIKPQIDPHKNEAEVIQAFERQFNKFVNAVSQIPIIEGLPNSKIDVRNGNFLRKNILPTVDLIITSPPYVTSYEYADLHQLSTLWLDYVEDYRAIRKGSIGSVYNCEKSQINFSNLNSIGKEIVDELLISKKMLAKAYSVGRYYLDMQKTIQRCFEMLAPSGMAFFVVGDTEYKGVKIRNSEHLTQCLLSEGFTEVKVSKRRISNKLLTPYRDENGQFSSDKSKRTVYHEEFIISGRKHDSE